LALVRDRCDVVVVGAGLLGLAAARALSQRGADVIVLEQAQVGHEAGGSKGSCRIFRLGYPDADDVALARRARQPWSELEDECGQRLLHPAPHLTFGPGLEKVRSAMEQAGAPCELLPAAEAAARFPQVAADGPALLEPGSCVISADAALAALAAAVPGLRASATVTGIADDGREVTVRTAEGTVTAGAAVVCAGPWTSRLLSPAGISVPSVATLEQVGYLAPAAGPEPAAQPGADAAAARGTATATGMPIFISHGGDEFYGLPVPGSTLYKIGLHHSGPATDPSGQDQRPDPAISQRLAALARRCLPGLRPDLVRTERCVYDNSPDEDFIVDRAGRIVVGCGTSGHGFKFGPLLGGWLADLAAGRDPGPAAHRFSLERFTPGRGDA
jgi:sarcosine oxidase